jgi:serine-type D-Ala-D-Ala carboxypeptidase/endopeptidase (penicillin-binding protein 4)
MKRYIPLLSCSLAGLLSGIVCPVYSAVAQPALGLPGQLLLAQSSPQCAALGSSIDAIIAQPGLRSAHWGILAQSFPAARPLYSKNADQLFLPASNAKLLTTAAALTVLPARLPQQTPLFATGQAPALKTLRIYGQGDPSLTDRHLDQLASSLKAKGIQSIDTLIGDDSFFQGRRLEPSWSWEDLQGGDGLPVNSLILNGNIIKAKLTPQAVGQPLQISWLTSTLPTSFNAVQNLTRTTSSPVANLVEIDREEGQFLIQGQLQSGAGSQTIEVPVPNPGFAFLEAFRGALKRQQIQVNRLNVSGIATPISGETLVATLPFPTLSTVMAETNQQSNNLYAETLLRLMGTTAPPKAASTPERGIDVAKQALTRLGVDPSSYRVVDGSGLSRKNLVSPKALVGTLAAMAQSPNRVPFMASLAVAGQKGTLTQRFLGTPLAGHFYGKTGTLDGVSALSGFVQIPAQPAFIVSIIVDHSTQSSSALRSAIDQIVLTLTRSAGCF